MSDEELLKRLRNFDDGATPTHEAAARIEALTEQLEAARADAKEAEAYAEELDAKLGQAMWLLTEAAVQLEEGKIKTRRNRAQIIWKAIDEMANSGIGKAFDDDAEGLREKLRWSDAP